MNYRQTLDYLYTRLPMFQRIGHSAYKANLNNTIAICNLLGNPERKFQSVHIAGTNGKGSTSHFIASILQSAGYKTGLYTSPHLKDFRERIKINGKNIPRENVTDFVEHHKTDFENIHPSFFEMTVGLAFAYFATEQVDIAVIETGLGGRLDSTNIITPELSIITNIGFDHLEILGDTLAKIAAEKAGIIKPDVPVVIGESQQEILSIFKEKAKECGSEIYFAEPHYRAEKTDDVRKGKQHFLVMDIYKEGQIVYKALKSELSGLYQLKNIVTVLQSVEVLKKRGFNISEEAIREGVAKVVKQTGIRGRWEEISLNPLTICDTGHNIDGIKQVVAQLSAMEFEQLHFVFGAVNDKAIEPILQLLPKDARYYFCKADIPRGLDRNILAAKAKAAGLEGKPYPSVKDALHAAQCNAKPDDLVFVGGSTFVVAEAI